jgi:hypothetical protein
MQAKNDLLRQNDRLHSSVSRVAAFNIKVQAHNSCLCNYYQFHCGINYVAVIVVVITRKTVDNGSETLQTGAFYLSTLSFTKILVHKTVPMVDVRNVSMKHWRNDTMEHRSTQTKTYPGATLPKIPQGLVRDKTWASMVGLQRPTA